MNDRSRSTRRTFCRLALGLLGSAAVVTAGCDDKNASTSNAPATAPAASGGAAGGGTIGVSLLTLSNPFFRDMGDAITAEAAAHGMKVQIVSADLDSAKQRDQVKNFIVAHVSAIVLTPADSRAVGTAIKEANAAGIPVFTADVASLSPDAKVVSHIATDNFGGGKMAGEAVVELLGGKGKVAIIDHPEVESVIQRTKGFMEVVSKHPDIQVVATLPGGGERDRSFKVMQDILQAHPDINAVFAINDPSALGAVSALEAATKLNQIKVIGFDGQPEAKIAIRDGKIFADAIQYPDRIGKLAVQAIVKFMNGEPVEPQTLIPTGLYKQADAKADTQLR
ncbi:MAG: substrate-binding domain-containing protein [Tepidisphaeraceae bacterium]